MLTKVFFTSGPNLVILVWTGHQWTHTDVGNNNTWRPTLALSKNKCCERWLQTAPLRVKLDIIITMSIKIYFTRTGISRFSGEKRVSLWSFPIMKIPKLIRTMVTITELISIGKEFFPYFNIINTLFICNTCSHLTCCYAVMMPAKYE